MKKPARFLILIALSTLGVAGVLAASILSARASDVPVTGRSPRLQTTTSTVYLPLVATPLRDEVRAVWVSRYDWTDLTSVPTQAAIETIVDNVARAGFNTIFFQVRGAGDAYYQPGPEPWASRLTGTAGRTLGQDPGWDPLAAMISLAHMRGISVHAYINVYPAWQAPPSGGSDPLTPTLQASPPQWLNQLTYGSSNGGLYGLGWTWRVYDASGTPMPIAAGQYTWASPAVPAVRESVLAVAQYLMSTYDLDGIHLDNVRYPGAQYSYDPFTLAAFDQALQITPSLTITEWRGDFQRAQVSNLVAEVYSQAAGSRLMVSAAVWPRYVQGRDDLFQDPKSWLGAGTIDAVAPMLYSSDVITDLARWTSAVQDYQSAAAGRWILPGIGVTFNAGGCVPFGEIASRIEAARTLGTAGQAVFSYKGLLTCGEGGTPYLDLLAAGPYASPARPPAMTWK